MRAHRRFSFAMVLLLLLPWPGAQAQVAAGSSAQDELPPRLSDTGLFEPGSRNLQPGILSYAPQYPLWSDGATKQRWIRLPSGTSIDGTNPDAWDFPPGTRIWKEFSHGRPIETRFIERLADGSWRFASYVWNAEGTEALLAPEAGVASMEFAGAPDGRYAIPSRNDCTACHEGGAVPVLSFSALQLAADRDPGAVHAEPKDPDDIDYAGLIRLGLLRTTAAASEEPGAALRESSPTARAALGYLHANCGHCHNADGPLSDIGLVLAQSSDGASAEARVLQTTVGQEADSSVEGLDVRIVPGSPEASQLVARMKSSNPYNRMPPLGTRIADGDAVALVEKWIEELQTREGE
jgi:hypothetical protein